MMMMMIGIYLDTQIILYSLECENEKNEKREKKYEVKQIIWI